MTHPRCSRSLRFSLPSRKHLFDALSSTQGHCADRLRNRRHQERASIATKNGPFYRTRCARSTLSNLEFLTPMIHLLWLSTPLASARGLLRRNARDVSESSGAPRKTRFFDVTSTHTVLPAGSFCKKRTLTMRASTPARWGSCATAPTASVSSRVILREVPFYQRRQRRHPHALERPRKPLTSVCYPLKTHSHNSFAHPECP